jgi:hypothetical protein
LHPSSSRRHQRNDPLDEHAHPNTARTSSVAARVLLKANARQTSINARGIFH